jgi:hypothetical protein
MNPGKALLISLLFAATAVSQQTASDVVTTLRNRYKAENAQLDATEAATKAQFAAAYAKELTRTRDIAQAKGDLDAVIQINNLITAANTGDVPAPPSTASVALRAAYTNYDRNVSAALRPLSTRRQQLDAGFARELSSLEQQYTRSGLIEAAKLAREARIEVTNNIGAANTSSSPKDSYIVPNMTGVSLKPGERLVSEKSFKPPVEIEWHLKPDGDFRIIYACGQMIFNHADSPNDILIGDGPAHGQDKQGVGATPTNREITIKMTVQPKEMVVSLDGHELARWRADFSAINQSVGISTASTAKVKQVTVRKLK